MAATADRSREGRPNTVVVVVADESGLTPIADALLVSLPSRAFLSLDGDLGAGKTTFVKALAAAAGIVAAEVVSPTFGLIHLHALPAGHPAERLVHADLYRLGGCDDLIELGWEELLTAPGWVAAEWATRIGDALPIDRLDVAIGIVSEASRPFIFTASGPRHLPAIAALATIPGASSP